MSYIIGKKIGMTQIFDDNGKVIPVTVVEASPMTVIQKKTNENNISSFPMVFVYCSVYCCFFLFSTVSIYGWRVGPRKLH